jgi:hypothetical protein
MGAMGVVELLELTQGMEQDGGLINEYRSAA